MEENEYENGRRLKQEIFARNCAMDKEKPTLKIPFNQIHPKWKELMSEYRTRFEIIIDERVSEKLRSRGYANSFGGLSQYFYSNCGAFSSEFTMRKEDVASIIRGCKKFCVYGNLSFPDKSSICKFGVSIP